VPIRPTLQAHMRAIMFISLHTHSRAILFISFHIRLKPSYLSIPKPT
jgi:hypothetical protein